MKPEDRPKVVVLSIAILITVVFIVYTIIRSISPPKAAVAVARPGPASATTTAPPRQLNPSDMNESTASIPSATRDPFTPIRPSILPGQAYASARPSSRVSSAKPFVMNRPTPPTTVQPILPPVTIQPGLGFNPVPSLLLKGIITGTPPVAVIQVGDQTFYRRPGESIIGGWTIKRINDSGVFLQSGQRSLLLTIGGSVSSSELNVTGASPSLLPTATRPNPHSTVHRPRIRRIRPMLHPHYRPRYHPVRIVHPRRTFTHYRVRRTYHRAGITRFHSWSL